MMIYFYSLLAIVLLTQQLQASEYEMYRWNENYRYLGDSFTNHDDAKFKYISLSANPDNYVSFGGTLRERINHFDNDRFGLIGQPDGSLLLHRLLVHADLHLNKNVRMYAELGNHRVKEYGLSAGPYDSDSIDLAQAFIDFQGENTQLRLGRQEFSVGSGRLVSVRDGPNVRRVFDGATLSHNFTASKISLFNLQQVEVDKGRFNNQEDDKTIWGLYSTWALVFTKADVYFIGLDIDDASYQDTNGEEQRYTLGTRLFGSKENWDWNYEFMYQFGDFADQTISAWSIATLTNYHFNEFKGSPKLTLSANIASGDDDSSDQHLGIFNPILPNISYFEEAAILAPQNFVNIEPKLTFTITPQLSFSIDWDFFWRLENNDAVYVRGLNPLPNTIQSTEHFVADIVSLSVDYSLNKHVNLDYSLSYFNAGDVIKQSGGKDVTFMKLQLEYVF